MTRFPMRATIAIEMSRSRVGQKKTDLVGESFLKYIDPLFSLLIFHHMDFVWILFFSLHRHRRDFSSKKLLFLWIPSCTRTIRQLAMLDEICQARRMCIAWTLHVTIHQDVVRIHLVGIKLVENRLVFCGERIDNHSVAVGFGTLTCSSFRQAVA